MGRLWDSLFTGSKSVETTIRRINNRREELTAFTDAALKSAAKQSRTLAETIAITAVVAARVLGFSMFDVQLQGALALANGNIAEMQTGEGKTLAAVPAVVWYARESEGVHVMTANDYLARRDTEWMGEIYRFLNLSVGCIQQGMTTEERRRAYACDVTYATANEIGFDYLRDQLALYPQEQVHRGFAVALVDEADSILIDEARTLLVIAGDQESTEALAHRVDALTRHFRPYQHYVVDEHARNVALTDAGIAAIERAFGCRNIYELDVEVIPTNRPMIRVDHPDVIFNTRNEKEQAVIDEVRRVHRAGQPVLLGTASVEESERLSSKLHDIPHQVLNARNDEVEAAIIARAGERGAATISTNMAGRGTDIRLGEGVAALGGLFVIGTNKHENRRIDNQLRGRAGRQGDPGQSQFFVSFEDNLLVKYGLQNDTRLHRHPSDIQRLIEGQQLSVRMFLNKYERVTEGRRRAMQQKRQDILDGTVPCNSELERLASMATIDDLWSEYLAALSELRSGIHWVSLGGGDRDPLQASYRFGGFHAFEEYIKRVHALFEELQGKIEEEIPKRLAAIEATGIDPTQRGSTWTYMTTDQPYGTWMDRALREYLKKQK